MGLDIRFAVGSMFGIIGALLTGYGVFGDKSIYQRSLGINVNLIWGAVLILFSALLLWFASRKARKD